ncbi:MAG: NAD(P)H-dependent oxidoreductase, partial [Spirochaetales bacterium]|nr:NAD(P)H-dependent oxidoreductase [Spirochaetales bacterium]
MIGIYFSGTGNSRYAAEYFINLATTEKSNVFSIEDEKVIEKIKSSELLIFSYPVQFSSIPKFLQDFIIKNKKLWNGKKIFIIATMGLFSGDGSGILGRLLKKYGAKIIGGLHLKMP